MSSAVCCLHNRCPDRPRRWLRRFRNRPWYCDQCGRLWVTVPRDYLGDGWWEWKDLTASDPRPPQDGEVRSVKLADSVGDQTLTNKVVVRNEPFAPMQAKGAGGGLSLNGEPIRGHWANAGPPIGLYPTRVPVHSHGPEEGAGMACPERWVDGRLVGACLPDAVNVTSDSEKAT